jgi:hypothetical protein
MVCDPYELGAIKSLSDEDALPVSRSLAATGRVHMPSRPSLAAHMRRGWSLRDRVGTTALLLGLSTGIVFFVFPEIDLQVGRAF